MSETNKSLTIKVRKLLKKFKESDNNRINTPAPIEIDHSLEKVKTNGWEKLNNIIGVKGELEEELEDLKKIHKSLSFNIPLVKKALKIINDNIIICETCKGKQGYGDWGTDKRYWGSSGMKNWTNCHDCNGNGYHFKKTKN